MKHTMMSLVVLFAGGCQPVRFCDYPAGDLGWRPEKSPPAELKNEINRDDRWFKNDEGDYLSCPYVRHRDICESVRTFYRKHDGFREDLIVCTG